MKCNRFQYTGSDSRHVEFWHFMNHSYTITFNRHKHYYRQVSNTIFKVYILRYMHSVKLPFRNKPKPFYLQEKHTVNNIVCNFSPRVDFLKDAGARETENPCDVILGNSVRPYCGVAYLCIADRICDFLNGTHSYFQVWTWKPQSTSCSYFCQPTWKTQGIHSVT